jgi:hypothetical protein
MGTTNTIVGNLDKNTPCVTLIIVVSLSSNFFLWAHQYNFL